MMAKYNGNEWYTIEPKFRNSDRSEFSDNDVISWWNATANGIGHRTLLTA